MAPSRARCLRPLLLPAVYSYFPLLRRMACVVCYHDATAERFPELLFPTRLNHRLWQAKTALALLQTTRAMTVSETSASDLESILRVSRDAHRRRDRGGRPGFPSASRTRGHRRGRAGALRHSDDARSSSHRRNERAQEHPWVCSRPCRRWSSRQHRAYIWRSSATRRERASGTMSTSSRPSSRHGAAPRPRPLHGLSERS